MVTRIYPDIRTYLRETGTTQAELAVKLGITQPGLSKIINGLIVPKLALAFRISKVCNIPVEALLPEAQRETPDNSCV